MSEPADTKPDGDVETIREALAARAQTNEVDLLTLKSRKVTDPMVDAALAALSRLVERIRGLEEKVWAFEINQEETDECTADLFSLVCAVLDGDPEAADAHARLQKHIEHVRACRKGSCDTELRGSRLRRENAELREALEAVINMLDEMGDIKEWPRGQAIVMEARAILRGGR